MGRGRAVDQEGGEGEKGADRDGEEGGPTDGRETASSRGRERREPRREGEGAKDRKTEKGKRDNIHGEEG